MSTDGHGLEPLPVEQWSEQARAVLPGFLRRPELYLSGRPDAQPMPKALGMFAHHVPLGAAWMGFTDMLVSADATVDAYHRELAILRVAWKTASNYEWKQHTRIALGAGVTTEQLYAVAEGPSAPVWTPLERAVLDAADQVVESCRIAPATWAELAGTFSPAQLLELTFIIGSYHCFAAVVNSTGLQADPPTEAVDAPDLPSEAGA